MLFIKTSFNFKTYSNFDDNIYNGAIVGVKTDKNGELKLSLIDRNDINNIGFIGLAGNDAKNSNNIIIYRNGEFITDNYCEDQVAVSKYDEPGYPFLCQKYELTIGAGKNKGKFIIKKEDCWGNRGPTLWSWSQNNLFTLAICQETNCYVRGSPKENNLIRLKLVPDYDSKFESYKFDNFINTDYLIIGTTEHNSKLIEL